MTREDRSGRDAFLNYFPVLAGKSKIEAEKDGELHGDGYQAALKTRTPIAVSDGGPSSQIEYKRL